MRPRRSAAGGSGARRAAVDDADAPCATDRTGRAPTVELGRLLAEHQALAAADEHAQRAVVGRDASSPARYSLRSATAAGRAGRAGRWAAGRVPTERAICWLTSAMRCVSCVDVPRRCSQVLRHAGLQAVDLRRRRREARRDVLRARQHHLARRRVLRLAGQIDQRVEQLSGGIAEALLAGRNTCSSCCSCSSAGLVGRRRATWRRPLRGSGTRCASG